MKFHGNSSLKMAFFLAIGLGNRRHYPANRRFGHHNDPFVVYNDEEMYSRFRFTRNGLIFLENLIGQALVRATLRSQALSPRQSLCLCLRYLASGSFQEVNIGLD